MAVLSKPLHPLAPVLQKYPSGSSPAAPLKDKLRHTIRQLRHSGYSLASFNRMWARNSDDQLADLLAERILPAGEKLLEIAPHDLHPSDFDRFPRVPTIDRGDAVYACLIVGLLGWALYIGSTGSAGLRLSSHMASSFAAVDNGTTNIYQVCQRLQGSIEMIKLAEGFRDKEDGLMQLDETIFTVRANTLHESTRSPRHVNFVKEQQPKDARPVSFIGCNRQLPINQTLVALAPSPRLSTSVIAAPVAMPAPIAEVRVDCAQCDHAVAAAEYAEHLRQEHGATDDEELSINCPKCQKCMPVDALTELHPSSPSYTIFSWHARFCQQYPCPGCTRTFRSVAAAKDHYTQEHTSDRPWKCTYPSCNEVATTRDTLDLHYRNQHLHTGPRSGGRPRKGGPPLYPCGDCTYPGKDWAALDKHREDPKNCDVEHRKIYRLTGPVSMYESKKSAQYTYRCGIYENCPYRGKTNVNVHFDTAHMRCQTCHIVFPHMGSEAVVKKVNVALICLAEEHKVLCKERHPTPLDAPVPSYAFKATKFNLLIDLDGDGIARGAHRVGGHLVECSIPHRELKKYFIGFDEYTGPFRHPEEEASTGDLMQQTLVSASEKPAPSVGKKRKALVPYGDNDMQWSDHAISESSNKLATTKGNGKPLQSSNPNKLAAAFTATLSTSVSKLDQQAPAGITTQTQVASSVGDGPNRAPLSSLSTNQLAHNSLAGFPVAKKTRTSNEPSTDTKTTKKTKPVNLSSADVIKMKHPPPVKGFDWGKWASKK